MTDKDLSKPVAWPNGCDKTAVGALEYLAENKRPIGGSETYNTEHLYMIARELGVMTSQKLYAEEYVQSLLGRVALLEQDHAKPVAWMYEWAGCVTCEGPQDWRLEITDEAPPSWAVIEGQCRNLKALFPREYVNLLLSQIASLKSERETMHSAEYVQSLLDRIAELELDRDVWQASALALRDTLRGEYQRGYAEAMSSAASGVRQLYIQHTHHVGVDGLLNRCNELEQSFIQSEENHRDGLTVQED